MDAELTLAVRRCPYAFLHLPPGRDAFPSSLPCLSEQEPLIEIRTLLLARESRPSQTVC